LNTRATWRYRPQGGDARELDWATVLGRISQKVGRGLHFRHVVFGFRDDLAEAHWGCVPKTLNPTIVVMKSAQDGA
jgi:hypothetical protein